MGGSVAEWLVCWAQIGFTFLVPAHPGSPGKRAVKQVCVLLVCVCQAAHVGVCISGTSGLNSACRLLVSTPTVVVYYYYHYYWCVFVRRPMLEWVYQAPMVFRQLVPPTTPLRRFPLFCVVFILNILLHLVK